MARKCHLVKAFMKQPKFRVRKRNRCQRCGRQRGYIRRFGLCRICLRELSSQGLLSGVRKASW